MRRGGFEKNIIQGAVECKRRKGRPMISWTNDIKRLTEMSMDEALQSALNQERWREIFKTTAARVRAN